MPDNLNKIVLEIQAKLDEANADLRKMVGTLDDLSDAAKKADKSGGGFEDFKKSAVELKAKVDLVKDAYGAVMGVLDKTIGKTLAYSDQVRDLARISGLSTEEASRFIQVADDLQVEYSTLTQALKTLAKDGISLTTEELANASDEYLSFTDAGARAEYAVKKFGKAGLELTKILDAGGDAIREMSAGIDDNLILTEAQTKAARDLEIALDDWNDTLDGLIYNLVNQFIPILNEANGTIKNLQAMAGGYTDILKLHSKEILTTSDSYYEYTQEMIRATLVAKGFQGTSAEIRQVIVALNGNLEGYNKSWGYATEAEYEAAKASKLLTDRMAESNANVKAGTANLELAETATRRFGGSMEEGAVSTDKLSTAQKNLAKPISDANTLMQEYTVKLLYAKAAEGLSSEAALVLAEKLGLVYGSTKDAIEELELAKKEFQRTGDLYAYAAAVQAINDRMANLKSKTVNIDVITTYITRGVGGGPQSKEEEEFPNRWDHTEGEQAGGGSVWHWNENSHSWTLIENQYDLNAGVSDNQPQGGSNSMVVNVIGWQGDGVSLAAEISRQQQIKAIMA